MAYEFIIGQFNIVKDLHITLSGTTDANKFIRILESRLFGNAPDSPRAFMAELGDKVAEVARAKYDTTRSTKNKRRTGKLRSHIKRIGPFMDNKGSIIVRIGETLPKYADFLEFGVKPSIRTQTYQVVGGGSRRGVFEIGVGRNRPKAAFRIDPNVGTFAVPSSERTFRLIPRKKEDLARIKRKITLSYMHPGFPGAYFMREGYIYLTTHADNFITQKFKELFRNIDMEVRSV